MPQIKWHVIYPTACEYNRFPSGVREAKFVEHIRILVGEFCQKHLRLFNFFPDLLHDTPSREQLVRPYRLETGFADRRHINLLVVAVVPRAEWHHYETRIEK